MLKIIQLFLIILLLISCKKNGDIQMKYEQTQCADRWGYGTNDAHTKNLLGLFLDSAGIKYSNLELKRINSGAACAACTCESGGLFSLTTTESFTTELIKLGFKRK